MAVLHWSIDEVMAITLPTENLKMKEVVITPFSQSISDCALRSLECALLQVRHSAQGLVLAYTFIAATAPEPTPGSPRRRPWPLARRCLVAARQANCAAGE